MSADLAARGLAGRAQDAAGGLALRALGNVGTRMFGGRLSNSFNNTAALTFETTLALAQPFDAVRLVFAAGNNAGGTAVAASMLASIAVVADPSSAAIDAASWTGVTVGASGTWSLAPSTAFGRSAVIKSDWIPLPSVPRGDGGALPLLVVRAWVNGGNPIVLYGNGAQDFSNWASHPSGRIWRVRSRSGNYASTAQASFSAGAAAANTSPLIGVQYLARGKVVTLWGFGDSITEGQGSYIGEGAGLPVAVALSASCGGLAFEWAQCGWSGVATSTIRDRVNDFANSGLMDVGSHVAVLPCGSPNDAATTIPASGAGSPSVVRGQVAQALLTLTQRRVEPLLCTWAPTNASVRPYAASDALRRAYNDEVRGWAQRGMVVADFDAALAGTLNGAGQVELRAGLTTDGIHPNDAGNAVMAGVLARAVRRLVAPVSGLLAA